MPWDRSSRSDSRHILQMYSERKICFKISKSETPRSAKCVRMYSVPTHCFPSQSGHWIWPIDREFISRTVTKTTNSAWNVDFRCHAKPCNSWHEWRSASNSSYMVPMMDFFSFGQPSWISSRSPITIPRSWMGLDEFALTQICDSFHHQYSLLLEMLRWDRSTQRKIEVFRVLSNHHGYINLTPVREKLFRWRCMSFPWRKSCNTNFHFWARIWLRMRSKSSQIWERARA